MLNNFGTVIAKRIQLLKGPHISLLKGLHFSMVGL